MKNIEKIRDKFKYLDINTNFYIILSISLIDIKTQWCNNMIEGQRKSKSN